MGKLEADSHEDFDDEMRTRLYFYDQLAGTMSQPGRVRREQKRTEPLNVPKDVADRFVERVGLADTSPGEPITVRHVDSSFYTPVAPHSRRFPSLGIRDGIRVVSAAIADIARTIGGIVAFPYLLVRRSINYLTRDTDRYVVNATRPNARSARRTMSLRTAITALVVTALVAVIGVSTFVYFRQQAIHRQEAAEQAQFEKQRQAWLCTLSKYEQQQQSKTPVKEASCAQ